MQIQDIMVRDVITVSPAASIAEVADLLLHHGIHAVPVVDERRKVVGIITETDFFLKDSAAIHLPTYAEVVGKMGGTKNEAVLKGVPELRTLIEASAQDIMTPNCITLPDVADVRDMITLVRMRHFKTFPVTDFSGKLVGIITLIDVVKLIGKDLKIQEKK